MSEISRRGFLLSAGTFAVTAASGLLVPPPLRAAMGPNDKFDLLVKGGEVLDPSQKRAGKVHLEPAHAVAAGVAFGRPYQAPFTVR